MGSIISDRNSINGALGGVVTIPGNQPSHTLNTRIRRVALTNSGIVIAKIAMPETHKSGGRSLQSPAIIPRKIAIGTPMSVALKPSTSVLRRRIPTMPEIGLLRFRDMPRSPCSAPRVHSAYRVRAGRSIWKSLRQFSRRVPLAMRPR